jgi:hypothetical protein
MAGRDNRDGGRKRREGSVALLLAFKESRSRDDRTKGREIA